MDYSHITVLGRATGDADLKTVNKKKGNGTFTVLSFKLATNSKRRNGEHTNYFTVELYNGLAEKLAPYIKKGKPLLVTGECMIQVVKKEQEKTANYLTFVTIVADQIRLLSSAQPEPSTQIDEIVEIIA